MKLLAVLQKIMASFVMVYGILLIASEDTADSLSNQVLSWLYGLILIALSVGWLLLVDWEENKFIETR